jgi:hypothetical protein
MYPLVVNFKHERRPFQTPCRTYVACRTDRRPFFRPRDAVFSLRGLCEVTTAHTAQNSAFPTESSCALVLRIASALRCAVRCGTNEQQRFFRCHLRIAKDADPRTVFISDRV